MLSARWEPFTEMNRLRREMDRLFDWGGTRPLYARSTFPSLNIWENDDNLFVEAELPGFALDDLDIMVSGDNQLSVSGERKTPELEGGTWHGRERGFGKFNRAIELPGYVDSGKVSAELKNGVLTITLPKREEVKPRRIEVRAT